MKDMRLGVPDNGALRVPLAAHQIVTVPHIEHTAVEALGGPLWITIEGRQEDRVLEPGERLVADASGLAVIEAIQPTEVLLLPRADSASGANGESMLATWWRRLAARFASAAPNAARACTACQASVTAAMRCWRTARGDLTAANLGLERTY
jgi:hypothetical protein